MRKAISGIGQLIGILIAVAGIIVSMSDTADLDKQILTMFTGLGIFLAGAGVTALFKWGEENVA